MGGEEENVSSTPTPSFRASTTSGGQTKLFRRKSDPTKLVVMRGGKTLDVPEHFMSLAQADPTTAFDKIQAIRR